MGAQSFGDGDVSDTGPARTRNRIDRIPVLEVPVGWELYTPVAERQLRRTVLRRQAQTAIRDYSVVARSGAHAIDSLDRAKCPARARAAK